MSIEIFYFKVSLGLSSLVFFRDAVPFIIKLFTFSQPNLHFYQTVFKINFQRYYGIALLGHLTKYLSYFILMKKKLPHAKRVFVEYISLFIGTDIHLIDEKFFALRTYKSFFHTAPAHAE